MCVLKVIDQGEWHKKKKRLRKYQVNSKHIIERERERETRVLNLETNPQTVLNPGQKLRGVN